MGTYINFCEVGEQHVTLGARGKVGFKDSWSSGDTGTVK